MSDKRDNVSRVKRASPAGTSTFVGLRTLDVFLQYGILAKGLADPLLDRLSVSHVPSNLAPAVAFGLPLKPLVLIAMAAGSTIKQVYNLWFISQEEMPVANAIPIGIFNTIFNSANSILSLTTAATYLVPQVLSATDNQNELSPLFIIGTIGYAVGLLTELVSEVQRRDFKKDPRNAGKAYTGGLFSLARHINYGGYTIWRASYALATGGPIWGSFVGAFFFVDFAKRGVPVLDDYCTKRVSLFAEEFP
ncbi:hypothetical protein G7Y89_g13683 [Cudoniella acicularis]|uniref:Steroid 5-alpha reductase C-terminal domain-containing protein n=1 Tax=Cudoniella acicularis TaxID=354080 RepID=A0A8H4R928_9HELO|nr:hypothetical protein G7Y89_g13683 [Cudoniella acicularis]